ARFADRVLQFPHARIRRRRGRAARSSARSEHGGEEEQGHAGPIPALPHMSIVGNAAIINNSSAENGLFAQAPPRAKARSERGSRQFSRKRRRPMAEPSIPMMAPIRSTKMPIWIASQLRT